MQVTGLLRVKKGGGHRETNGIKETPLLPHDGFSSRFVAYIKLSGC